jgi:hypothetical protein
MATTTDAASIKPPQELTSILSQVQSLQTDRERLMRELEDARSKMDKLQVLCGAPPAYLSLFLLLLSAACLALTIRLFLHRRRAKEKR